MINPSLRLRRAIHAGDAPLVSRILKSNHGLVRNPDFSSPNGLSNTSLHLASLLGHISIVQVLLRLGHEEAHDLSLNEEQQTPLMLAASHGHIDIVHYLCTSPFAGLQRRDARGRDAIMFASLGGHDTCLQILLTFCSSNQPGGTSPPHMLQNSDSDGNTALHLASANGHLLVLRTLLAAGADPEVRNIWHWTAVSYSATVAAEVYFKGLVQEMERRRKARREAEENEHTGTVRMVKVAGEAVA